MRTQVLGLGIVVLMMVLGPGLSACSEGNNGGQGDLVTFDALITSPQRYANQYVCTQGAYAGGFEVSGLASTAHAVDGCLLLDSPVIWLERGDFQKRENCTRTDTVPSFEFCHVVVCGVFETGGTYGHGGAYAYQLTAKRQ